MPFHYTHGFSLPNKPADLLEGSHNPHDATPAGYHTPQV
jgi:hypothetical protein